MEGTKVWQIRLAGNMVEMTSRTVTHCILIRASETLLLLSISLLAIVSHAADNDIHPASQPVAELHDTLLYLMQNANNASIEVRYEKMAAFIATSFDIPLIAQVILNRDWNNLDQTQQTEFISLYENLVAMTYITNFNSYAGEEFRLLETSEMSRGRLLVKTELKLPDEPAVRLDYLMHRKDAQWKIISVIANGINDIAIKRGEYADIIRRHGFEGLIIEIRTKLKELQKQA